MEVKMEKLEGTSFDIEKENIEKLKELFPNIVTDGKIDFEMLRTILGEEVEESREKYQFTWNGKTRAIKAAQIPSSLTLRPCPEKSKKWNSTKNIYIEGDNLEVLKQLQKTYHGKIKMIYIDPPYNTGHDFVYKDNFNNTIQSYEEQTKQGSKSNPETSGRYHTDWMNMIYPRLILGRSLLRDDGVIFISIGEQEQHNLRKICDEIFGENNFLGCAGRISKKANNQGDYWAPNFDYLLTYAKQIDFCKPFYGGFNDSSYKEIEKDGPRKGEKYQLIRLYMTSLDPLRGCVNQRYYIECPDGSFVIPPGENFPDEIKDGGSIAPQTSNDKVWRWSLKSYLEKKDEIVVKEVRSSNLVDQNGNPAKWNVFTKTYLNDVKEKLTATPNNFIEDHINQIASHELGKLDIPFDFAKPTTLVKYLAEMIQCENDDIILDFFSGSGTTADAIMQLNNQKHTNCRFVLVQLPEKYNSKDGNKYGFETLCDIGEERIRRAGESIKKEWEDNNKSGGLFREDNEFSVDIGFKVFKLDSSNINAWDNESELNNEGLMKFSNDVFKEGRSKEDILYEIMLKYGIFDREVSEIDVNGKTMYQVGKRYMIVCLEDNLTEDDIRAIGEKTPNTVVFKESGFKDDNAKINAVYNLEKAGVKDIKCI